MQIILLFKNSNFMNVIINQKGNDHEEENFVDLIQRITSIIYLINKNLAQFVHI